MLNFMFTQVYVMVLIVCSGIIEPVELFNADFPLKSKQESIKDVKQVHIFKKTKLPRDIRVNCNYPVKINRDESRYVSKNVVSYSNVTDNPNNEQKLMVETFIKSSNSLFKRETDSDEKVLELQELFDSPWLKLRLLNKPIESKEKSKRSQKFVLFDNVTARLSDSGRRQPVRDSLQSSLHILKNRFSRSSCCMVIKDWNSIKDRLRYHHRRNFIPGGRKRELRRHRGRPHYNVVPARNNNLGSGKEDKKTIFTSELPGLQDTYIKMEFTTPDSKRICKRQGLCNPMRRSHCKKKITLATRRSVNEGKTGKILFPSTHRCLKLSSCPCSLALMKCPPRVTCPPVPTCGVSMTIGRCSGVDNASPSPPSEDFCPVRSTRRSGRSPRKRCPCDCGCACPAGPRRPHPDRAIVRGSCGCGCGCGCSHHTGRPDT